MIEMDRLFENYFSGKLTEVLKNLNKKDTERVEEIRIRLFKPLYVRRGKREIYPIWQGEKYCPTLSDIEGTINKMSGYSIYAFNDEIKRGFLTLPGGCRVGICGEGVYGKDGLTTLKNISAFNVRIAREVKGCSDSVMPYIYKDRFYSTLVVSPPACGKTTLLRDIIRKLSDGGLNIGLADERGEIAGTYMGQAGTDVGKRTDVLDGCVKAEGMYMLLRSMAPDVIAADEIGSTEELKVIREIVNSGVGLLCSVHAGNMEDMKKRPVLKAAMEDKLFERYIVLSSKNGPGTVEKIYDEELNELC